MLPAMTTGPEDSELMMRYADGDAAAFDLLYDRHRGPLYRYFLRQCLDEGVAAELFQQVWSRVIKARHRYRAGVPFTPYLYQNAHHCFVEHLRRQSRPPDEDGQPAETGRRHAAMPDSRLAQVLASLAPDQREAFILQQEAGLDVTGIAGVIGIDAATVRARLGSAIGRLRQAITTGGLV